MNSSKWCLISGLFLAAAVLPAGAGGFTNDFNSGDLPPGSHTNFNSFGGAFLELTGGVNDSGCLKLTKNINSQNGSFILDDLDMGSPIYGFDMTFKLRIGGGTSTPADGMSLCLAPDLADTSLFGESGAGNGLRFCWDIYSNPDTPPAPRLYVATGGTIVAWKGYNIAGITTSGSDALSWWTDVHIRLNPDGSLNLDYKGANVFTNFFIPGYQAFVDAGAPVRFGFGARCGGLNANQWVDDLKITTFTTPMVGISTQPFSQKVLAGDNAAFDVRITNPNGVTLQWYKDNVMIPWGTSQTLVVTNVSSAISGSKYKVTATGPFNTVTSSEVTLTVIDLALPATPQLSYDFNDGTGLAPLNTTNTGTAMVYPFGGVANSGAVQLTMAANGQAGAFVVSDPNAGAPVYGFTARFKMLVGGGTVPPADGFAFAFGNDIPDIPSGEFENGAGLGSGLRVTFDIYNNDGIFGYVSAERPAAPSIDVRYGDQLLGSVQLPLSFMETTWDVFTSSATYDDTIVQLNTDGTVNVVYRGALIFDRLPVPAFASIAGGRFAIAARTGGLNENIWVDDIQITTDTTAGALRITKQPVAATILVTRPATYTVAVNNPAGVTYQWFRDGGAMSGATDASYTLPAGALSDSGAKFKVQLTQGASQLTSDEVGLTVVNLAAPANPNLTFTFDDGLLPAGTITYSSANGGGYITAFGGVNNSGVLHLTDNVGSQSGAFIISNLFGGAQVSAIAASWDARLGGGSGNAADGYSFNFANNLAQAAGTGENGTGNGVRVCFDIYGTLNDNPPAPNVKVYYKGSIIGTVQVPKAELETGNDFRTVLVRVDSDGKLYFAYGDRVFFNGLQLPNYTFTASGQFGFYARTGGENENQWIDNIKIEATKSSGPLAITAEPADATVVTGYPATFSVSLSDPSAATYQWSKNGTAISGATLSSYTTPLTTAGDNGATYRVSATAPSGTATSRSAVLTVVPAITLSNPTGVYDFNDCTIPTGTILNVTGVGAASGGYIACFGGITNSGCLHLTDNVNDVHSAFIMPDPNDNAPVKAFTAHFAVRVAEGSGRPADGFSWVWAPSNSIPDDSVFGQDGVGSGLVVGFDTYDNNGEAPSFNVWYRGTRLANKLVDYSVLYTGNLGPDPVQQYADVFIRVNENGTLDLQYKGIAVFIGLPLPGYAAMAGGKFAIGAQTGGENETHWVDNIEIATTIGYAAIPLGFSQSASGLTLIWGEGFKLQSTTTLSPPNWQDETGITSGMTIPIGAGNKFYRLISLQ